VPSAPLRSLRGLPAGSASRVALFERGLIRPEDKKAAHAALAMADEDSKDAKVKTTPVRITQR